MIVALPSGDVRHELNCRRLDKPRLELLGSTKTEFVPLILSVENAKPCNSVFVRQLAAHTLFMVAHSDSLGAVVAARRSELRQLR